MAVLRELTQGRRVRPAARCLVGRAQHCHLVLGDSDASREHAVIFYDARGWHVRDLSSRNGTVVHGVRVKDVVALERGSEIGFGAASNAWVLDDADPPAARAISQTTGQALLAGPSGLQLPGTAPCEAYVSSQDGQWLLERSGELRPVSDKEQLRLANDIWLLELTVGDERPTAPTATLEGLQTHLIFKVSRNEEHVELTVERGGRLHVFAHRSHTYLLLLLARARLKTNAQRERARASTAGLRPRSWQSCCAPRANRSTFGSGARAACERGHCPGAGTRREAPQLGRTTHRFRQPGHHGPLAESEGQELTKSARRVSRDVARLRYGQCCVRNAKQGSRAEPRGPGTCSVLSAAPPGHQAGRRSRGDARQRRGVLRARRSLRMESSSSSCSARVCTRSACFTRPLKTSIQERCIAAATTNSQPQVLASVRLTVSVLVAGLPGSGNMATLCSRYRRAVENFPR